METPPPPSKKNNSKLENIVDKTARRARKLTTDIFGPLSETGVPKKEIDELMEKAPNMTPLELAHACHDLFTKYSDDRPLPDSFENWLKNRRK